MTIRERIGEFIAGKPPVVSEMIGRYTLVETQSSIFKSRLKPLTYDATVPDYEFFDRLRRGAQPGFLLGGLFTRRIETIFSSWVFGLGVTVKLRDGAEKPDNEADPKNYTDKLLAEFLHSLMELPEDMGDDIDRDTGVIFRTYEDSMGLGDQYIIVNADGSLSMPSPDTVERIHSTLNMREVVAYVVTTRMQKYTIIERYEAETRRLTIKEGDRVIDDQIFSNLIGRIPVIHIPHDRGSNETHGHSVHEVLRPLYDQYDDVLYKQLDGAKLLGNPLLAFVGMKDIDAVINANDTAEDDTYLDKDGNTETRKQLKIDENAVLLVGEGGDAKFVAPPTGYSTDTKQSLKSLFLLLLDRTGIPEFVWGNEISSGRSSSETQLQQWIRDIAGRQLKASGWLLKLCTIWLQMKALTDPKIVNEPLKVVWPELIADDKETLLKVVQFARDRGLLTARTALELLTIVDNPGIEAANAEKEMDAQREKLYQDEYQGRVNTDIQYTDDNPDGSNV